MYNPNWEVCPSVIGHVGCPDPEALHGLGIPEPVDTGPSPSILLGPYESG